MTKKQRIFLSLITIFVFLLSLIITMPARQAYKWNLYPPDVQLSGISGHYLSGQSRQLAINDIVISDVSWKWQPMALFLGKMAFDWQVKDRDFLGQGRASLNMLGNISLSDSSMILNAEKITPLLPEINEASGNINIKLLSASLNNDLDLLSLSLKAETELVTINTMLGDMSLQKLNVVASSQIKNEVEFRFTSTNSPDEMNVLAELKQDEIKMSGHIDVNAQNADNLKAILPFIAKRQGKRWLVSWLSSMPK